MHLCASKYRFLAAVVLLGVLLCSCNMTKFVPEDQSLLYKVHVNVDGTKEVQGSKLKQYLRQTPNTEVLGFWKLQLHVYNTAPVNSGSYITGASPILCAFSASFFFDFFVVSAGAVL